MRHNIGDLVKIAQTGMNTKFMEGARETATTWSQIADLVPSTQIAETYPWLGNIPNFLEFQGERKRRKLSEYSFTIPNKPYEVTIAIKRQVLATEQYGKLNSLAAQMGRRFPTFLEATVYGLLQGGFTATAYDGQNFFDADHSEGVSGTQSNTGTTALSATSFAAARAQMMNLKDDQGVPMGINPNLLIVAPGLGGTAREIVVAQTTANGGTNINQGLVTVVESPYLTDANNWYLLDTRTDKPLVVQELEELEVGFQGPESHIGWNRAEYEYGAYWDGGFGYADWRRAYGAAVA